MAFDKLLAQILRRRGGMLVDHAVRTLVAPPPGAPPRKTGVGVKLAETLLLRVATKSVPGAIIVGGGLLARHLHERHMARKARAAGALLTPEPAPGRTTR